MNRYLDQLIDLFLNEEKWDPEAARQKAGNVGMKAGEGRTVSPNIKQGASPTIVGDKGVLQVGSGRGRKKKEAGKINKPLSDSIDRLQHLLETAGDDTTAPPDDAGYFQNPKSQKAARYTSQLEKIHGYLKDNEESMEDLARKDERAGLRMNLLQGIDGVGRSHAILKGIEGITKSPAAIAGARRAG